MIRKSTNGAGDRFFTIYAPEDMAPGGLEITVRATEAGLDLAGEMVSWEEVLPPRRPAVEAAPDLTERAKRYTDEIDAARAGSDWLEGIRAEHCSSAPSNIETFGLLRNGVHVNGGLSVMWGYAGQMVASYAVVRDDANCSVLVKHLSAARAVSAPAAAPGGVEDGDVVKVWEDLKDNLPPSHAEAAEALYDVGDRLADEVERLRRLLSASPAAPAAQSGEGWQPIDTAPKGAKGYAWMQLAWGPDEDKATGDGMYANGKFYAVATFYCAGQSRQYQMREIEVSPTHWMPLPSAPAPREA
ncbi:DUF551 domain-containing protein [Azospirillum argentinense]|uniref:DUF551 domain-containing protein n=1 Tax=Azospirillum argentinense TaxID=2970906 RepID=A0ABW8V4S8_9PROT